jgi:fatty acid CoA ligase FadD9
VTGDSKRKNDTPAGLSGTPRDRVAQRIRQLDADDEQFRNAKPDLSLQTAARQPGLRLPQILQMFAEGYADRPALGWRARELTTDPATGRTTAQLLPRFDTITYRDLWANVRAVAAAWRRDEVNPVAPGDFVATLGFSSPEYLTLDLVCGYLGLVAIPLQHSAAASRLQPIIAEIEPQILATGAGYLDLAVEAALGTASLRRLVVFDYQPAVDDQREKLESARAKLAAAGMAVTIETFDELIERGHALPSPAAPDYPRAPCTPSAWSRSGGPPSCRPTSPTYRCSTSTSCR